MTFRSLISMSSRPERDSMAHSPTVVPALPGRVVPVMMPSFLCGVLLQQVN